MSRFQNSWQLAGACAWAMMVSACGEDPGTSNAATGAVATADIAALFDSGQDDTGTSSDTGATSAKADGETGATADTANATDTSAAPDTTAAADITTAPDTTTAPDITTAPDTATAPDTNTAPDTAASHDTATAPDTATTADTNTAADTATAPDTTIGADTATAPDTAAAPDTSGTDAGVSEPKTVRFAALGDTGTGSEKQYAVGKQLAAKCKAKGCDFVLMLGDNFYDTGVTSENDAQFKSKFEDPYKDVDAPFYITLGNHDYGGGGTGGEFMKKEHYIKYSKKNPKFVLPTEYWHKTIKHVDLFSLDSNAMMFSDIFKGLTSDQKKQMTPLIGNSKTDWLITFSHHPYRSNGPHGNAGCYDAQKLKSCFHCLVPLASTICGKGVKEDFDTMICGKSDVHFSGHDHSFQWLKKENTTKYCKGVELIIAGSGAKTTDLLTKSEGQVEFNPVHYQNADIPGFLWVEIKGNTFFGEFTDMNGKVLFSRSFTK